jgi:hypothetical protein
MDDIDDMIDYVLDQLDNVGAIHESPLPDEIDQMIDYILDQLDKEKKSMSYENSQVITEIKQHINAANSRYGAYTSTHEALGVALEEWQEMLDAIRANRIESVREEAIDLAAVLIRLAEQCRSNQDFIKRSVK